MTPFNRSFWLSLFAIAFGMEAFAVWSQHFQGLEPCNECIYIRAGVLGLMATSLLGAIAPRNLWVRLGAVSGAILALIWSIWRAGILVNLERLNALGEAVGCKRFKGFPDWMPLEHWLPEVFEPRGKCGEIVGTFIGQSFAWWTLVGLGILALGFLTVCIKAARNPLR